MEKTSIKSKISYFFNLLIFLKLKYNSNLFLNYEIKGKKGSLSV